jgi:hypothetical protein
MTPENVVRSAPNSIAEASRPNLLLYGVNDTAGLLARLERVPFSWWHMRARVVMGSATLLDAFDALSLAFVLPILIPLWNITPQQVGILIGASYIGQLAGARLAERYGRIYRASGATLLMSVMSVGCAKSSNLCRDRGPSREIAGQWVTVVPQRWCGRYGDLDRP